MDAANMVENSLVLLEQMIEHPDEVRGVLDPDERKRVVAQLHTLEHQAGEVRTGTDLLALADRVHRLVEGTPALANLLLPEEVDVAAEQGKRTIFLEQTEPSPEALYVQSNTNQIINEVHLLIWNLEEPPQEDDSRESGS